ncbi:hypothetical protein JG687_00003668 [Phytophthora cactorum]|uniref:Gcp-like domain-containing protein n=1 Tax=Phytophthora cactorum TaxID=29920 RepID=A0A8T1UQW4_9STRA|nr:hypothetical protein JG687_00003668 [Phytophthora cactorum]
MLRLAIVRRLRPAAARHASYMLGIETSCDDTAAAVLDQNGRVLSSVISSQWELNAKWRGIVPALAARAHEDNLPHVMKAVIEQSGLENLQQLSAVAVTSGPGLAPCLDVGLRTARQICLDNPDIAFLQINHLEAHVLVSRLPQLETPRPEFPFVVLLVSGGHCCLVLAKGLGDYELLGNTLDDSIGEAYDKVARMLDITASGDKGVHGGKLIEDMAARGNDRAYPFTEPMKHRKTAMLREVKKLGELDEKMKEDLCASFQVVCGGVASNQYLRDRMQAAAEEEGVVAVFPPAKYCTDNGVMIAWAGLERYAKGMRSDPESARYQPRWPLETLQPL